MKLKAPFLPSHLTSLVPYTKHKQILYLDKLKLFQENIAEMNHSSIENLPQEEYEENWDSEF